MHIAVLMAGCIALHPDGVVPRTLVEGKQREAGGANAGKCADAIFDLLIDGVEARVASMVTDGSGIDLQAKNAFAVESSIHVGEVDETTQEESRTGKQNERKSNLRNDESFCEQAFASGANGSPSIF